MIVETWDTASGYVIMCGWQRDVASKPYWRHSLVRPVEGLEARAEVTPDAIEDRDGERPRSIILPEDTFPLLGCLQSKPVEGGTRTCDQVGEQSSFNLGTGDPAPGFMPGGDPKSEGGDCDQTA